MFRLDDCVTFIAANALKDITEKFNDLLLVRGSTRVQWIALYHISQNENIIQADLAEKINIKTSTMVRLIDRLEKEGLVKRESDKDNRRVVHLSCTPKGYDLNQKLLPVGDSFSKAISEDVSDEELVIFKSVLGKFVHNLDGIDKKI